MKQNTTPVGELPLPRTCLPDAAATTRTLPRIVVADDDRAILNYLQSAFDQLDLDAYFVGSGQAALAIAGIVVPDIILLDIRMPEMSGYEVCTRLKENEQLSAIPVIFLTALNEIEDKVKGFRCGGVDYISKPFNLQEVQARLETHVALHGQRQALRSLNLELERAIDRRTHDLAALSDRLTTLDRSRSSFLRVMSHDLRTPLNGILGASDLIWSSVPQTPANKELRVIYQRSRRRLLSLLDDALLITQIELDVIDVKRSQVFLSCAVRRALRNAANFAASRGVSLLSPISDMGFTLGDEDLIVRALTALVDAAVKFSQEGESVVLSSQSAADSLTLTIESVGRNIPEPVLSHFFEVSLIDEATTGGGYLGLGPALARRVLGLLGVSVQVANRQPSGITLTTSFPQTSPPGL